MDRARTLLKQSTIAVDIDTGGGEKLLDMRENWCEQMIATEGYPPNIKLAHERLSSYGVPVIPMKSSDFTQMPFTNDSFDLILNRHGAFNCDELARVLVSGGSFLTKQVHGLWAHDLMALFSAKPYWPDATPKKYVPWLESAGMTIVDVHDWRGKMRFTDVGAIVFYLKSIAWLVSNFSVEVHQEVLLSLQARLDAGESLEFAAWTYMIEARKP